jgi:DNA ligase (NAD+)
MHNGIGVWVRGEHLAHIKVENLFRGDSFCITGQLSAPREYYKNLIKLKGGKFKTSVSGNVKYLIVGAQTRIRGKKSTKHVKAEKLGIPVITEQQFYNLSARKDNNGERPRT